MSLLGDDCPSFINSTCRLGSICPFRHCEAAKTTRAVCSFWRSGRCTNIHCTYRHSFSQNRRSDVDCYWEKQPGGCTRTLCPFKHSRKPEIASNMGLYSAVNEELEEEARRARFIELENDQMIKQKSREQQSAVIKHEAQDTPKNDVLEPTVGAHSQITTTITPELTCPICLELFEDPVTLSCMHSYCRPCLQSILKSGGGKRLRCPECRVEAIMNHDVLQKMPRNFTIANIVAKCEKAEKMPKIPCDLCDDKPPSNAVKSCKECKISYCSQCLFLHPKKGVLATHSLVEPQMFEIEMEEKPSEKFCMKCVLILKYEDDKEYCQYDHPAEVMDTEEAKTKMMSSMTDAYVRLDERNEKYRKDIEATDEVLNSLKMNEEKTRDAIKKEMKKKFETESEKAETEYQLHLDVIQNVFKKETKTIEDEYDAWSKKTEDKNGQYLRRLQDASTDVNNVIVEMQSIFAAQTSGADVDFKDLMRTYLGVKAAEESRGQGINLIKGFNLTERLGKVKIPTTSLSEEAPNLKANDGTVQNLACTPNVGKKDGCVSITTTWSSTAATGAKFEIKFVELTRNGTKFTLTVRDISTMLHTENRLQLDTTYDVAVCVQDNPSSISWCRRITTPPAVFCEAFQFSSIMKSPSFKLQWDNKRAEASAIKVKNIPKGGLQKLGNGAIGTLALNYTFQYWEVQVSFHFRGVEKGEYAAAIGICAVSKVDAIEILARNYFFYGIDFAKTDIGSMVISMKNAGVEKQRDNLKPERSYTKRIGFLFNPRKCQLSIIEIGTNTDKLLFTTDRLKVSAGSVVEYYPAFDLNEEGDASIELLTGSDIKQFPSSIKQALLI